MLRPMMDDFYELTNIPMSLIDLEGNVLVYAGWQDVCTRFHRVNPDSYANCIESVTVLTADIAGRDAAAPVQERDVVRRDAGLCRHPARRQLASPGSSSSMTSRLDTEFFASQAKRYGFDEDGVLGSGHVGAPAQPGRSRPV